MESVSKSCENTPNKTEPSSCYGVIEMLISFAALLSSVLIALDHMNHSWRIYGITDCYLLLLVCAVWCAAAFVKKLKRREVKTLHILILILIFVLAAGWSGNAVKCVRDIFGGTVTVTTEFYRPYKDNVEVYGEFPERESGRIRLYCTEKISAPILEKFSYNESKTLDTDHISIYAGSPVIEIKYYPNTELIKKINIL